MARTLICIFLIINVLHLSVDVWNSNTLLTEMNEEIEEEIEDSMIEDVIIHLSQVETDSPILIFSDYSEQQHGTYAMHGIPFEIDSPPPEWV